MAGGGLRGFVTLLVMTSNKGAHPLVVLLLGTAALICLAAAAPAAAPAASVEGAGAPAVLPAQHASWLREVEPLITEAEKKLFKSLERDYQREAFIEEFWKVRDPHPRTVRNELKERWPVRLAEVQTQYGGFQDDRARLMLVHGPPAGGFEVRCSAAKPPVEIWAYQGTDWLDLRMAVIFFRITSNGPARIWRPSTGGAAADETLARVRDCLNGAQAIQVINHVRAAGLDYERNIDLLLAKPQPSSLEWVSSFVAYSTDIDDSESLLTGELELAFPGRYQQRTVVQGLLGIDTASAEMGDSGGYRSFDFRLVGEVLSGGKLFETFRYQFNFAASQVQNEAGELPARLPLTFQRLLRPGTYQLIVKLEDLTSKRAIRFERELQVSAEETVMQLPSFRDPETEKLFAEATAALKSGERSVRLIAPETGKLLSGPTRFDTLVTGDIDKVVFSLDDKKILTRNRPPFNVEVDLGAFPSVRTLRAEALDASGAEIASDQLILNSGGYRFVAKLREPRPGKRYTNSLQARVEVEVPGGRSLERVEFFLNETKVATLFQEPFVQAILLPAKAEVGYVRAVAYLPDGNSTEDLVFINAPGDLEEVKVQFVELYTSVLDRAGRPVGGLAADDFKVIEDGVEQKVVRFEEVEDLPIHVGVMIDTSASMVGILEEVRRAALSFFERSLEPKDRAAVITFSSFPRLQVELTGDKMQLGRGLAGLAPEGKTALYDSVMFGLYYFAGIKGQRAILLLSDGRDESSRFNYEQTLDYARRAGVTLYTIGFRLADLGAKQKLQKLSEETGGSSFFIEDQTAIAKVYETIQREMRSQLLLAYQSSNRSEDGQFRRIELKVDKPNVVVKTLSGYYP